MRTILFAVAVSLVLTSPIALADTVILHDGSSYSGQLQGLPNNEVTFTDNSGVQYKLPVSDVQALVFTTAGDTVTLRNGNSYSGHYTGPAPISFTGNDGISYSFPVRDVSSLVFSPSAVGVTGPLPESFYASHPEQPDRFKSQARPAMVIPESTEISVRNDGTIDSERTQPGDLFPATITSDVTDSTGAIAIARGSRAQLVVRNITGGGAVHSPELVLDLFSVTANGKEYRVVSSDVDYSNRKGVGANKRTAEFTGGGAGIGALMGAILGGGKGAAIGAGSGAVGGLVTQLFTRGKKIKVPAETELSFRLDRTLVFRPSAQEWRGAARTPAWNARHSPPCTHSMISASVSVWSDSLARW